MEVRLGNLDRDQSEVYLLERRGVMPLAGGRIQRPRSACAPTTIVVVALVTGLLMTLQVQAQNRYVDVNDEAKTGQWVLPFGFYTSYIELAGGVAWGSLGEPQEQMTVLLAGYGSTNGSWGVPFVARDVRTPWSERLFLDVQGFISHYAQFDTYRDGNPAFPSEPAGSHSSNPDNFVTGSAYRSWVDAAFKYLLPIGGGREDIIHTYAISEGLLIDNPSGGGVWNPLRRGRTYLGAAPFYRSETVETEAGRDFARTNGITFSIQYDNTDFFPNPTRGSRQRLALTRDWGAFDSSNAWTNLEAEYSHYFPLPERDGIRQHVVALDVWTSFTPTWEQIGIDVNGKPIYRRPPEFMGANLGGFNRLRAFPTSRFSDKAAICYTAEYRVIPRWNPLRDIEWLKWADIKWVQVVAFGELGRVADSWSLTELHHDMNWDAGIGLRLWGQGAVGRADVAFGDEGTRIQLMVGQPF